MIAAIRCRLRGEITRKMELINYPEYFAAVLKVLPIVADEGGPHEPQPNPLVLESRFVKIICQSIKSISLTKIKSNQKIKKKSINQSAIVSTIRERSSKRRKERETEKQRKEVIEWHVQMRIGYQN